MQTGLEKSIQKLIDLMSKRLDYLEKESDFCAKNMNLIVDRLETLEKAFIADKIDISKTELNGFKNLNRKDN
tara:strand:+ start:469 stop:684 length:216 start_codon:yes stop_codon:yes gene_type:complete